ncbi:MAG: GAF domain-containing protein [Candidatus Omnitrophica bacterium]|nr:GAF domain-containing protein [Candidatus Omnitrophota bacterium]MDE2213779.1 GAF domain-containing protein [Candidatus Omnitrophota bacterium]MDE2230645.1 GAF domain-containing protein [Candidatus Omnitrophota bacterium]
MLNAPVPDNEQERLESLRSLSILDTPMEERFDRITKIAQKLFNVPVSTLSLVDSNREWFKSCQGLDASEGPRAISFCGHAMLADDLFVIPDALTDPRFSDNPMVTGKPHIRFYAGQYLRGPGGHKIGTLCIKDYKPREFPGEQCALLKDLAVWVEMELNSKELSHALEERRKNEKRLSKMFNALHKTHEELKQAQMQILQSEKMASIGQLAAGVAHEINNPVGFISNNSEMLEQYIGEYTKLLRMFDALKKSVRDGHIEKAGSIIKEIDRFSEDIQLDYIMNDIHNLLSHNQRGIERIQKIVMDLKTFAREGEDRMELVKIEEIIGSILSIVYNELKYKAELIKNYGTTPLVKCNVQRMGQVFINLLVNATQAIEQKGIIEVKTYCQGASVCVDVRDTGKGIEEDHLKKIFEPFFTTKPVGKGTGLGLSVSYEIVKKHGGEIKVRSIIGQGTTFTVMLPAAT